MKIADQKGFTLIELLLVVVIIGILLAVIVPRAWRANVDAKYGLVRQAGTELAAFSSQWAEEQIQAQTSDSTATTNAYFQSLCGGTTAGTLEFTGDNDSNWNNRGDLQDVPGRNGTSDDPPEVSVEGIVPPERSLRNPFNGVEYFLAGNAPSGYTYVPGAIACSWQQDGSFNYFGLIFQGTEGVPSGTNSFYAGMTPDTLAGLRNGIFMARVSR